MLSQNSNSERSKTKAIDTLNEIDGRNLASSVKTFQKNYKLYTEYYSVRSKAFDESLLKAIFEIFLVFVFILGIAVGTALVLHHLLKQKDIEVLNESRKRFGNLRIRN